MVLYLFSVSLLRLHKQSSYALACYRDCDTDADPTVPTTYGGVFFIWKQLAKNEI